MEYTFTKQVRDDDSLRQSFMDLAAQTFGLSFQTWYQAGYWSDSYLPYSFVCQGKIVANASVNLIEFSWRGKRRPYLQIGTVMTDPAFRGQGLSRRLIEKILTDWKGRCSAVYLFANNTVLDFYPKFGFVPQREYEYSLPLSPVPGDFHPLSVDQERDLQILKSCYQNSNPYSAFTMEENLGLLMFYCMDFMKHLVSYSPSLDLVCIGEQEGDVFYCYELLGSPRCSLEEALHLAAPAQARRAVLGFTPREAAGGSFSPVSQEDLTLFLLKGSENLFAEENLLFPALSHA